MLDLKNITKPYDNTIGESLRKRNIPCLRILPNSSHFQTGLGFKQKRFLYDNINNLTATRICKDKVFTKYFMDQCSIPTPQGKKVSTEEDLKKAYNKLQKPLVIKPISEMWGKGITTNINTWEELLKAYKIASQYKGSYVIVEEHIQGHDHRILIIGGKYVAGLKRTPPFIVGNGESTIKQLIEQENKKRLKSSAIVKEILVDETVIEHLKSLSLSLESVLEDNQKVYIRMTGNICSGGISENITKSVHPSIIESCKKIGYYLDMEILGIDVLTTDISQPLSKTGGKITEVNQNPDIEMHTAPYIGEPIDTSMYFVNYLFPNEEDAWIEISINDSLINTQEKLNQYLNNIPKEVVQINPFTSEKNTINNPDNSLYSYLLDVRTMSIKL